MAVPKKRHTKSRRNKRRMHLYLENPPLTDCPQCKEKKRMHTVCSACGYYKGREVIDVLKKEKKKQEEKGKKEKPEKKTEKKSLSMENLSKER